MIGFFLIGLVCVMILVLKVLEVFYTWEGIDNGNNQNS
jgi:hypothetical protein